MFKLEPFNVRRVAKNNSSGIPTVFTARKYVLVPLTGWERVGGFAGSRFPLGGSFRA